MATQNPIEQEGTYSLPEAQRDRFLFQTLVDYPSRDQEGEIIDRTTSSIRTKIEAVITGPEIIEYQRLVRQVPLPEHVKQFVLDLVRALRPKENDGPKWVQGLVQWGLDLERVNKSSWLVKPGLCYIRPIACVYGRCRGLGNSSTPSPHGSHVRCPS